MMNTYFLPLLIAGSFIKIILDGESDLTIVFSISIAVLVFFSLLLHFVLDRKNKANAELHARTVTFWWMLGFFLFSVATHQLVFSVLLSIFSMLAFYEYIRFETEHSLNRKQVLNIACIALVPICFYLAHIGQDSQALMVSFVFLLLILPVLLVTENTTTEQTKRLGHLSSGVLFFAVAMPLTVLLFNFSEMILLLCVFLTEFRDMSAYWIGKRAQKLALSRPDSHLIACLNHPVASQINSSKSWGVGLLSLLLILVLAMSFSGLINRSVAQEVSPWIIALWAVLIGILGLIGDLTFSMIKRDFNIKDSGTMMPGNTGIIDRVDALILTVPATYLLFKYTL